MDQHIKSNSESSLEKISSYLSDRFFDKFKESEFWAIAPAACENPIEEGIIFTQTLGKTEISASKLLRFLDSASFLSIVSKDTGEKIATLQTDNKLVWSNRFGSEKKAPVNGASPMDLIHASLFGVMASHLSANEMTKLEASKLLRSINKRSKFKWHLPTENELKTFAEPNNNPFRTRKRFRLKDASGAECYKWLTKSGGTDVDDGHWGTRLHSTGNIFACSYIFSKKSCLDIALYLIKNNLYLANESSNLYFNHKKYTHVEEKGLEKLRKLWEDKDVNLYALDSSSKILKPREFSVKNTLANIDYKPCRLPKLDQARMTDPGQGLWELYGEPEDFLREHDLVARNPSLDIQHRSVAIDFGTSSTVVAVDTPNGGRELLRVGVRDFYQPVAAHHFENPTVVECLDFQSFSKIWQQEAYRPSLNWDWMRASHEAQTSLRDNPGNPQVLASILSNLKHWALYSHEERRTRLSDRKGVELEIPPHTELNPVRGEALQVSENDPFDPIELYAWYLGMAINWRGRGLFLKYYLSFPVKYDRQIKDRILASFRRGLQRSLPRTLIDTSPSVLNDIEINDLATEPTAYAAAALARLDVEPTDDGVRYGVFDFGGGTTDFDYGLMRWSTDEEDAQGYEVVFESLGSSGDEFLGGENLLNHLVYETFSAAENLEELRSHRIQFTRPLDAKPFPGSEPFIAATQAAQTNTIMLAARLRSFMEDESPSLEPEVTLDLVDTNNEKQQCTLSIDEERLDTFLAKRIGDGFFAFLAQLAEVHGEAPHEEAIHCLLAGNGSRSRYLTRLMEDKEIWQSLVKGAFGNTEVNLVVHKPLEMSEQDPHAPTGKTGVALGLLRIKPGENTLLINHVLNKHDDQAPFSWFVGRLRRNQFKPMIQPNAPYGEWVELGPLQQGIFNLYSSRSPRAKQMKAGDAELRKQRLDFPAASKEAKLFARPIAPNEIALATAESVSEIDRNEQQVYSLN